MGTEFVNFLIFYLILTLMFVMIGNIMFMYYCDTYSSIFNAWTTVTNASMGNFTFTDFDQINENIYLQIFGKIYLLTVLVTFLILILNLLIAILSNVFNVFANLSMGLFLSKILSTRESLESDEYYGAFISAVVPFNILVLPFIPLALIMRKSERLIALNKFLLIL